MDFEAFINFEDLGLNDYIHNLNWDIKTKSFPANKFTSGDLRFFEPKIEDFNSNDKIFKQIFFEEFQEKNILPLLDEKSIPLQINNFSLTKNVNTTSKKINKTISYLDKIQKNKTQKENNLVEKLTNSVTEKLTNSVTEKLNQYFFENKEIKSDDEVIISEQEFLSQNTPELNIKENKTLDNNYQPQIFESKNNDSQNINIENILNQQVTNSNSVSIEQVIELEKNVNILNNNYVKVIDFKAINEEIGKNVQSISDTLEKIEYKTEIIEGGLNEQRDFFMKFINS